MLRLPQSALELSKRAVGPAHRPGSAQSLRGAHTMRMTASLPAPPGSARSRCRCPLSCRSARQSDRTEPSKSSVDLHPWPCLPCAGRCPRLTMGVVTSRRPAFFQGFSPGCGTALPPKSLFLLLVSKDFALLFRGNLPMGKDLSIPDERENPRFRR